MRVASPSKFSNREWRARAVWLATWLVVASAFFIDPKVFARRGWIVSLCVFGVTWYYTRRLRGVEGWLARRIRARTSKRLAFVGDLCAGVILLALICFLFRY